MQEPLEQFTRNALLGGRRALHLQLCRAGSSPASDAFVALAASPALADGPKWGMYLDFEALGALSTCLVISGFA